VSGQAQWAQTADAPDVPCIGTAASAPQAGGAAGGGRAPLPPRAPPRARSCGQPTAAPMAGRQHPCGGRRRSAHRSKKTRAEHRHLLQETGVQPFSVKLCTPTVAKEFQIGLYVPAEADLEHCWDNCSAGFFGELLYLTPCDASPKNDRIRACSIARYSML